MHLRADHDLRVGGLEHQISPCQFGGAPDCANCGCIASAALKAVGRHKLALGFPIGSIFGGSLAVGNAVRHFREPATT